MNTEYLKYIKKQRADSNILYFPYERNGGVVSPAKTEIEEMNNVICTLLEDHVNKENIEVWM